MDDFLHNLRSGKLKQPDRSNRPYNDQQYKGGQRRPMMDRRKRDFDSKDNLERIGVLKDVLENLADTQKRLAEAFEERNKTEERKAKAIEMLANNIGRMLNPGAGAMDAVFAPEADPEKIPSPLTAEHPQAEAQESGRYPEQEEMALEAELDEPIPAEEELSEAATPASEAEHEALKRSSKLTIIDQQTLFPMISRMREKGESWEHIARHIADQGYPTVSGKGVWRGVMVKNIFEKLSS